MPLCSGARGGEEGLVGQLFLALTLILSILDMVTTSVIPVSGTFGENGISSLDKSVSGRISVTLPNSSGGYGTGSTISVLGTFFKKGGPAKFAIIRRTSGGRANFFINGLPASSNRCHMGIACHTRKGGTVVRSVEVRWRSLVVCALSRVGRGSWVGDGVGMRRAGRRLVTRLVHLTFTRSVNSNSRAALYYVPTARVKGDRLVIGRSNMLTKIRVTRHVFRAFSPSLGVAAFVRSKTRIGGNSVTFMIRNGMRSLLRARHLVLGIVRHVDNVTAAAHGCIGTLRKAGAHMLSAHGAAPNLHVIRGRTIGVNKNIGRHVKLFSVVLLGSGRISFTNNVRTTVAHYRRCLGRGGGSLGVRVRIHGFSRLRRTVHINNVSHVVLSGFGVRGAGGTIRVITKHCRLRSSNNVAFTALHSCTRYNISCVSIKTLARSIGKLSVDFGTYWERWNKQVSSLQGAHRSTPLWRMLLVTFQTYNSAFFVRKRTVPMFTRPASLAKEVTSGRDM